MSTLGKHWKLSEEIKNKISVSMKGKNHPPFSEEWKRHIGEGLKRNGIRPPSRKGIKQTEETKKKISESNKGEKSYLWKGGITPENLKIRHNIEYRLWREAVFARDNWTCQICERRGSQKLNAHHINNFSTHIDLRFAIDNGITLCEKCHKEFHKKYGYKNNTMEQLEKVFTK